MAAGLAVLAAAPAAAAEPAPVAPAAPAPLVAGEHWRLIFPGRVEAIDGARPAWSALPPELVACWYWSEKDPPQRLLPAELPGFVPRTGDEVVVHRRQPRGPAPRPAAGGAPARQPAVLLAGPAELWQELPEELVPRWSWPAEFAELHLPRRRGSSWQVRLLDGEHGTFWFRPLPRVSQAVLVALPAAERSLVVSGDAEEPLAAATLVVFSAGKGRPPEPLARYQASAAGRITLPSLPDSEPIRILVEAPGRVPFSWKGLPSSLPPRLRLEAGASVTGRLVDGEGQALGGIALRLEAWLRGEANFLTREATSQADGRFVFAAIPSGRARLLSRGGAFGPLVRDLEVPATGLELGEVRLEKALRLRLRVLGSGEAGLVGARVYRQDLAGEADVFTTGEGGWLVLEGVHPRQPLELSVAAELYLPRQATLEPPWGETAEIRLDPGFLVRGTLLDEDGLPCSAGQVTASSHQQLLHQPLAGDASGAFELVLPVATAFELRLAAAAGGETRLALAPGQAGERRELGELRVAATRRVAGRLVSADDGAPVAGARIFLPRPGENSEMLAFAFGDLLETTSAADGRFELRGLSPGGAVLRIDAPLFARRTLALPAGETQGRSDLGDIELTPGAELEIATTARDGAVARLDLGGAWQPIDLLEAGVAAGQALFRSVPAGTALLTVIDGRELVCEEEVKLPERGSVRVECRLRPARVRGVVTLAGQPAGAGTLRFLSPRAGAPTIAFRRATPGGLRSDRLVGGSRPQVDVAVGSDGQFASTSLLPGHYQVAWSPANGSLGGQIAVDLAAGDEEKVLTLDFPAFRLRGRVVEASGEGVVAAEVRETTHGLYTRSGEGGYFELSGAAAGEAWLVAEKNGRRSPRVAVEVAPDGVSEQVDLELGQPDTAGELEVWLVDPSGAAPAAASVFLETAGGAGEIRREMASADAAGHAHFVLTPPFPARLRAGAFAAGSFTFGDYLPFEPGMPPIELELAKSGALRLRSERRSWPAIRYGDGWDVTLWLGRYGRQPVVAPGQELLLEGLPPGNYQGALGQKSFQVELREAEIVAVEDP